MSREEKWKLIGNFIALFAVIAVLITAVLNPFTNWVLNNPSGIHVIGTIFDRILNLQPHIYNFEKSTEGWVSVEGNNKVNRVQISTSKAYIGNSGLELSTVINGSSAEEVYQHSTTQVYFAQAPEGLSSPGPYNWDEKAVSCYVYLPQELAADSNSAYIRMFLKDKNNANVFEKPVYITGDNVEKWLKLSVIDQNSSDSDKNYQPDEVMAMGISIMVNKSSPINFSGSIYIDACSLETP